MIAGADLDHVAIAAERWSDLWPRYIGELGGEWRGGGPDPGFAWGQIRYANGMTLELLEPHQPELNDFLRRFLDRSGPGPHHLTFKVADIVSALRTAEEAGYRPVNVNLDYEGWKEAFLHPKDAPGVVIQFAESAEEWDRPVPESPVPRGDAAASLDRITHVVPALDRGLSLFERLLGGTAADAGEDETGRGVELGWKGPGRVRVMAPTSSSSAYADWLGDRPGRIHHLAFSVPGLGRALEVPPDDNLGVRLLLTPA